MDEGGAYYVGVYDNLDEAIEALVEFLDRPVAEWDELQARGYYPARVPGVDVKDGHVALAKAISAGKVPLPTGTKFTLKGSSYWEQFESGRVRNPE